MTVSITSSYRIGLVAGTGVSMNAPVVPAITTDDIFNPDAPTQTLTEMLAGFSNSKLLGTAQVDCTVQANTNIFTVPAGKVMFPTEIMFALTNISGSGSVPTINVGFTASSYTDYINAHAMTGIATVSKLVSITDFSGGSNYLWLPAAAVLKVRVAVAATYTDYDMMVYLFGFTTNTPV